MGHAALLEKAIVRSCLHTGASRAVHSFLRRCCPCAGRPGDKWHQALKRYALFAQPGRVVPQVTHVFCAVLQGLKGFAEGETAGGPAAENGGPAADRSASADSMSDDPIIQHVSVPACECGPYMI
jgi:hypothetical protein